MTALEPLKTISKGFRGSLGFGFPRHCGHSRLQFVRFRISMVFSMFRNGVLADLKTLHVSIY